MGLGRRLRQLRGKLSQKDFAKKMGIPFRTYQRYEYDERVPPIELLEKIASANNKKVNWLLMGSDDESNALPSTFDDLKILLSMQTNLLESGKMDGLLTEDECKRLLKLSRKVENTHFQSVDSIEAVLNALRSFLEALPPDGKLLKRTSSASRERKK